jgi:hypothetical protein
MGHNLNLTWTHIAGWREYQFSVEYVCISINFLAQDVCVCIRNDGDVHAQRQWHLGRDELH